MVTSAARRARRNEERQAEVEALMDVEEGATANPTEPPPVIPSQVDDSQHWLQVLETEARVAGPAHYRRMQAADKLLNNPHWMRGFQGNTTEAGRYLADKYLADLCGLIEFWTLLGIYRHFPNEARWQEVNYNLQVLRALFTKATKGESHRKKPEQPRISREMVITLQNEVDKHKCLLSKAEGELEDANREIIRLKEEINRLQIENATLRGRLSAMEDAARRPERSRR